MNPKAPTANHRVLRSRPVGFELVGLEQLEERRMLSVTFSVDGSPQDSTLNIVGDNANDTILLSFSDSEGFFVNDIPVFAPNTIQFNIARISIDAGRGSDEITIDASVARPGRSVPIFVNGNFGFDTLVIQGSNEAEIFDLGTKGINLNNDNFIDILPPAKIERFEVDAKGGDDIVNGAGISLVGGPFLQDLHVLGGAGNDRLIGGSGNDTLSGQNGVDSLFGRDGNDTLFGGEGSDNLRGENGDDTLNGGIGNDDLFGGLGNDLLIGGAGNDFIIGEAGNDILNGNDGADQLSGGEGNDRLNGGIGNDILGNGGGTDNIDGGTGFDEEHFSVGRNDSTIKGFFNSNANLLVMTHDELDRPVGQQQIALDRVVGVEKLVVSGGLGNDNINLSTLSATSLNLFGISQVNIAGSFGADTIVGTGIRDVIHGDDGNDLISGKEGNDLIFGDAGNDEVNGGDGNDIIRGGDGDDRLFGATGADQLIGNNGADRLDGSNDNDVDVLVGGTGNDILDFRRNDIVDGGQGGVDLAVFAGFVQSQRITADRNDATNELLVRVDIGGAVGTARAQGIEELFLRGGPADDFIDITNLSATDVSELGLKITLLGLGGNDELRGSQGNDTISGADGDDLMFGGGGDDFIVGSTGNDTINGGPGKDLLLGEAGDDVINGGDGNDTLEGDGLGGVSGNDILNGGAGDDDLSGRGGDDRLNGGIGNDNLKGDSGNDIINGNEGDDVVFGLAGNDIIRGGDGNDDLFGGNGDDTIEGGSGDDDLFGEAGDDLLDGGSGNNTFDEGPGQGGIVINGTAGNDLILVGRAFINGLTHVVSTINGAMKIQPYLNGETIIVHAGAGNDVVSLEASAWFDWQAMFHGGSGNDSLYGGFQNDQLYGEAGNDWLFGLSGNDILVGGDGNDWLFGQDGRDLLIGGNGTDQLFGGMNDDVVIGGRTAYDANDKVLLTLAGEWDSSQSYSSRVSYLVNGISTRLREGSTVFDDGNKDNLFGELGRDLFLTDISDNIFDRKLNERVI